MKRMGDWVKQIDCFDKGVCTLGIKEWQAFKKKHLLSSRSERKIRCRLRELVRTRREGRRREEEVNVVNNVERGDEKEVGRGRANNRDINF